MIVQKKADDARAFSNEVIPLMVYQSTQGGRMYLMAYRPWGKYFLALRFDYIVAMKTGEVYEAFDETELVIRVLSFGPMVKVIEPESFVEKVRERIFRQRGEKKFLS